MDTCTVQEHHALNALHMNIQFDFHKYVYWFEYEKFVKIINLILQVLS